MWLYGVLIKVRPHSFDFIQSIYFSQIDAHFNQTYSTTHTLDYLLGQAKRSKTWTWAIHLAVAPTLLHNQHTKFSSIDLQY